jgi:hypothetical protein
MEGTLVDLRWIAGFVIFGVIHGLCLVRFLWLEDGHSRFLAFSTRQLFRRGTSAAAERWRRAALAFLALAVGCYAGIGAGIVALMLHGAA